MSSQNPLCCLLSLSCDAWQTCITCNTCRALSGNAGATADAFTLFERLESQLEAHPGKPNFHQQELCPVHGSSVCALAGCNASLLYVCAGQLKRAAVELAKLWRLDKYLRRLDVRCQSLHFCAAFKCMSFVLASIAFKLAHRYSRTWQTSSNQVCMSCRRPWW